MSTLPTCYGKRSPSFYVHNLKILLFLLYLFKWSDALTCVMCNASSNHLCNLNGITENCSNPQDVCYTEIRENGGVHFIRKGCMQAHSCQVQMNQNFANTGNTRCNSGRENSLCHHCCAHDNCNIAKVPEPRGKNMSCLQSFPLCRESWYIERNGFVRRGRIYHCHCDWVCETENDCCTDYSDICKGTLPPSLSFYSRSRNEISSTDAGILPLRCFSCSNAATNEQCNSEGQIVECLPNQRSCYSEVRTGGGQRRISKGCKQQHACDVLQQQASMCGYNQPCVSCCEINYCNIFLSTRSKNFSSSCLVKFPGFPQCKRPSLSRATRTQSFTGCTCDAECKHFRSCCDDYEQLCESDETDNMSWIFSEIESLQPSQQTVIEETSGSRNIFGHLGEVSSHSRFGGNRFQARAIP
uniref:uncharacterized protein LOC108950825 n=1 Tax=Ciona intestinalis TaxID=7719 RepID=UPI000EF44FB8|nr:uncharacterized protein LOC108950825 [Ciona intestinalis]|eukprot:XP_018672495.2 uncharacterized protein LOC108950825 [Ciona intestinalis]